MLPFTPNELFHDANCQRCYKSWLLNVFESNSRSQGTIEDYNYAAANFFTDPKKKPGDYDSDDVRRYINQPTKRGKPPAPDTRNTRLRILKSFYSFASCYPAYPGSKKPLLQTINPCSNIKQIEVSAPERDMTEDEMRRFMAAIPRDTWLGKRDRLLFLWYFYTARRRTEVSQLLWSDLEELPGGRWAYRWKGKGKLSKDRAELPRPVVKALREYLEADGRWGHMQPDDPIFPGYSKRGKAPGPINPKTVNQAFRKYAAIAGLPDSLCPHAIRHLAARLYDEMNGGNLAKTAKYLGHSEKSLPVTLDYLKQPRLEPKADPLLDELAAKYGDF